MFSRTPFALDNAEILSGARRDTHLPDINQGDGLSHAGLPETRQSSTTAAYLSDETRTET